MNEVLPKILLISTLFWNLITRDLRMNFSLYKSQQKPEIINLFQNTFLILKGQKKALWSERWSPIFSANPFKKMIFRVCRMWWPPTRCRQHPFSKLSFPNEENVFLLAPVAVATKWHGQGIGQALIRFGLEALKTKGVSIVMTYGDIRFTPKSDLLRLMKRGFKHHWLCPILKVGLLNR